jgi:vanillate/3-O-methylgallate O-demethylase
VGARRVREGRAAQRRREVRHRARRRARLRERQRGERLGALAGPRHIGLTHQTATLDTAGTILALTLINKEHATPGTEVTVIWGEHPGAGTAKDADLGFQKIRATVAPAPYDAYAATQYRRH